jgi:membrane protein DedA with SNARE-associated domain
MSELFSGITAWILLLIKTHSSLAVFFGVLVEEIIIPIPSPLILMAAGYILLDSSLTLTQAISQSLLIIVIPAATAGTIGSFFPYYIGHFARRKSTRWQDYVGIKKHHIKYLEKRMEKNSFTYIVLSRAVIIIPMSFVSFVAGFLQLPKKKFAIATFVGTIPRALILSLLGWYFGNTFTNVAEGLGLIENIILVLIVFVIAFFLIKNIRKRIKLD